MTKVIAHATISLDGFMAGLNDTLDWVFEYNFDKMADEVVKAIGAVVLGRRTFDISISGQKNTYLPYGGLKVPCFVVQEQPEENRIIEGVTFTFVNSIEDAVREAKAAAGNKNVMLLGASIDQQCIRTGLADEIVVHIAPILLGSGIRMFDHFEDKRIQLEKLEAVSETELTSLRFRIIKGKSAKDNAPKKPRFMK